MTTHNLDRKLAAILSADAKGYSRLMGDDEEATVRTITLYREVMTAIIEKHRGRVVDSPGDNLLAEFASVVDAVLSGVAIQEELETKNAALPENRRMQFRLGINLGDVIHEGERIYGDGVNIAARVESLAEAGGICISGSVYDQVKNKLPLGYEDLGEHEVKNIQEPVRVYRIHRDPGVSTSVIARKKKAKPLEWQKETLAVLLAILVVVWGLRLWKYFLHTTSSPRRIVSEEKMVSPLPDRPSIAVLPFDNLSDDPKQEYFADGITEDLITDLSKVSGLFVIARHSVFTYKGKSITIPQVAEELGVRYVLEGSVRKAGEKVRINAQLIDSSTGHHLWANRYDGELSDIFVLQDQFTRKIVAALAVKLSSGEQELVASRGTDNVEAYDAVLQGWEYLNQGTRESLVEAVNYFKKALELDPDYGRAHASLARAYQYSVRRLWNKDLGWPNARSLMKTHLQEASKHPTFYTHQAMAVVFLYERRHEEAIAEAERAVVLAPNDPDSHFALGRVLVFAGRPAEALDYLRRAMRLNPHDSGAYLYYIGLAQYGLDQFEKAAISSERSLKLKPKYGPWILAVAYAQIGRGQEAADIFASYFEKRGWKYGVPVEDTFKYWPFKEQRDLDRWAEGLVKAGLTNPANPAFRCQYEEAIAKAKRAISRHPEDADSQFLMGQSLILAGRSAEAIDYLKSAISLNPDDPPAYVKALGLAQFCLGRYPEALTLFEEYDKRKPNNPKWLLVATYAHLDRQEEASKVLAKYMKSRRYNNYTVERVLKYYLHAFKDPKDTERFAQGLHKAGLPMK
jgi:TolB-like protein/class 3 adenylate cyclase/Flp pilus assembly protein TadD